MVLLAGQGRAAGVLSLSVSLLPMAGRDSDQGGLYFFLKRPTWPINRIVVQSVGLYGDWIVG